MIFALLPLAAAAPPADPLLDVLTAELERNRARLSLPNAPPIYHLRYHLLQLDQRDVQTSFGALVGENADPYALFAAEMRTGSPAVDNTGFGGWQDGSVRATLPEVLTEEALAVEAWRSTDVAYKQAVEQYARKTSQWTPPPDHPGDYTLTGAVVADSGVAPADPGVSGLVDLAKALSGELGAGSPPEGVVVLRAEAHVGHESGSLLTVDTEGTRVRTPVAETTIRALAAVRASDGQLVVDQRLWTVRSTADLPPRDQMLAEVKALRDGLFAVATAAPLADEYVGPVVFEEGAALDVFRFVLAPQLEGTPPEIPFDSFFGELGEDRDPVRLGRRVLPPGWTVTDDPQRLPAHPGSTTHDNEGTPAKAVELVEDGVVRALAMSRVPRKGVDGTNGHARGYVGQRPTGRVNQLAVEPDRRRSQAKLVKEALKLARAYDRDWVLVIRRLQEPCVLSMDSDLVMDQAIALPPPLEVVRRYADGREEPVRGLSFAGIDRWLLRDIVLAGPEREGDYFAPLSGSSYTALSPTEGLASHLWASDVLVGEVELVPMGTDPRELPVLAPPVAAR